WRRTPRAGPPGVSPIAPSWHGTGSTVGPATANIRGPAPENGSNQGATHSLKALEPAILQAKADARAVPQEITGPGTLFPALVIGLGQVGLTVMQKLREDLSSQLAPLSQLPNLRFLLLDTDPEVMR